jgi:hypothetical protein
LLFRAETGQENRIKPSSTNVPGEALSITASGHGVVYWLVSPVELLRKKIQSEYVPTTAEGQRNHKTNHGATQDLPGSRDCIDVSAGPQVSGRKSSDNLARYRALIEALSFERDERLGRVGSGSFRQAGYLQFRMPIGDSMKAVLLSKD